MNTMTEALEQEQEREQDRRSMEPVRFHYGTRSILVVRVLAGLMGLPFIAAVVTRNTGAFAFFALLLVIAGAWLLVRSERGAVSRPASITVSPDGLSVTGSSERELKWTDITSIRHDRFRGAMSFGTRMDPDALTIDAGLENMAGFLETVTRHVDASRRGDEGAQKRTRGDGLFRRSMIEDLVLVTVAVAGVILGLMFRPALFALTVLAVPRLLWHWLRVPHSVAVDDTAVWIVRPFTRDVIPLRAVSDVSLGVAGRIVGPAVTIEHRDRGSIVISGFGAAALPLYDAIVASRVHARAAARTGPSAVRRGSAIRRTSTSRGMLILTGAVIAACLVGAWFTMLTGMPLRTAAQYGNVPIVRIALLLGSPLETVGADGLTALHHAAERNDAVIAGALIRKGANTNTLSASAGLSALHIVAQRGHRDVAELLVGAYADVNQRNPAGHTPLAQSALPGAAADTAVARMLLNAGAAPNLTDSGGRTSLHHAAANGHADLVRRMARSGANTEAADMVGQRPLHLAVQARHPQVIAALIDARADINAPDGAGRTPLVHAASAGVPIAIVTQLLDAGASATLAGDDGWHAVQLAARANNVQMLELFTRRRVPLGTSNTDVGPALWVAADHGNVDAARVLMRGGASPYVRWNGRSPLEVARSKRNANLVALMQIR